MTALCSDTAGRGNTRVDLGPIREPAETPRARLHRLASRGVALLRGDESRGARLVSYICRSLSAALADLSVAEHRAAVAERNAHLLDSRLADVRDDLVLERERHAETLASYRALLAQVESFEVDTKVRPNPVLVNATPAKGGR